MDNTFYSLPFDKKFDKFDYTLDTMSAKSTYCLNTCIAGTNFSNSSNQHSTKSKTYTDDHYSQRYDLNKLKYDSINDKKAIYEKKKKDKYSYLDQPNTINQKYFNIEPANAINQTYSNIEPANTINRTYSGKIKPNNLAKKFYTQEINIKSKPKLKPKSKTNSSKSNSSKSNSNKSNSNKSVKIKIKTDKTKTDKTKTKSLNIKIDNSTHTNGFKNKKNI